MLLMKILNRFAKNAPFIRKPPSQFTCIKRWGSDSAAYQGDGKTTVRIINNEEANMNLVNSYSTNGFRLSNQMFITGSIILFPTHVFSWAVNETKDITPESLILFDLIVPKTKIVVIGYGDPGEKYDASIPLKLKQRGISCEMLPTPSAVTTYNYLVCDSVHVAGAFVVVKEHRAPSLKDVSTYAREYSQDGPYMGDRSSIKKKELADLDRITRQKKWEKENLKPGNFEP